MGMEKREHKQLGEKGKEIKQEERGQGAVAEEGRMPEWGKKGI